MLCHEGLQDTQAAPGGHFSAMEQEANSHHLPEAKRNPSEGLQPKKTLKTLTRSLCTQNEQNFQRGEGSVPAESVPRNISNQIFFHQKITKIPAFHLRIRGTILIKTLETGSRRMMKEQNPMGGGLPPSSRP